MDQQLLQILRCPQDRSALSEAPEELLTTINNAVREGRVKNLAGRPVNDRLEGGLVRSDGDLLYPIVDGIPLLLSDEAIPINREAEELAS